MLFGTLLGGLGLLVSQTWAAAQMSRTWITETSVTWGRGGFAYQGFGTDAVVIGDLGLRWVDPSGSGWGLSLSGGYDAPNEAVLLGGRGRYGRTWGQYRGEASLALLFSSLDEGGMGGIVGVALYARAWGALLLQVDLMPTEPQFGCLAGEACTQPRTLSGGSDLAVSYGLRIAERPAVASWLATGVVGLIAWALAGEVGCC